MSPPSLRCLGPTRRSFLELGAYSLCGLGLGNLAKAAKTNDKAVSYTHLTLPTICSV